jgi:hypothetical protein
MKWGSVSTLKQQTAITRYPIDRSFIFVCWTANTDTIPTLIKLLLYQACPNVIPFRRKHVQDILIIANLFGLVERIKPSRTGECYIQVNRTHLSIICY